MSQLSQRLLPVLQLTRMALVFTALADSGCELLLRAAKLARPGHSMWSQLDPTRCLSMALISIGLYGFGMSLNDIIDRRRDRQMSPGRPLPSGRIGLATAHVVCALLLMLALLGVEIYASLPLNSPMSVVLVFFTAGLIVFYDVAAKYLVSMGLLSLGLIRFFHATIAAPHVPVLWHPLLLMNHVTILSTIGYHWEKKRPMLRPQHWWSVMAGLAGLDAAAIGLAAWRQARLGKNAAFNSIALTPGLLLPLAAVIGFIAIAFWIRRRNENSREAGQRLVLTGLLWLIVYDAAFVCGEASIAAGLLLLLLLPIAYFSVLVMRWWSKLIQLSQRPTFKRVET